MATQDDYIRTALRVPPELHAKIHESAKENNRTFNAEIVARLEGSFQVQGSGMASMKMTAEHAEQPTADEIAEKVAASLSNKVIIPGVQASTMSPEEISYLQFAYDTIVRGRGSEIPSKPAPIKGPAKSSNARKHLK